MRRTHAQFYGYATYTVCRWQFLVLINTLNVYIACTMFFLRTGQEKKNILQSRTNLQELKPFGASHMSTEYSFCRWSDFVAYTSQHSDDDDLFYHVLTCVEECTPTFPNPVPKISGRLFSNLFFFFGTFVGSITSLLVLCPRPQTHLP